MKRQNLWGIPDSKESEVACEKQAITPLPQAPVTSSKLELRLITIQIFICNECIHTVHVFWVTTHESTHKTYLPMNRHVSGHEKGPMPIKHSLASCKLLLCLHRPNMRDESCGMIPMGVYSLTERVAP